MGDRVAAVIFLCLVAVCVIAGVIRAFQTLRQRLKQGNRRSVLMGLVGASVTAVCVFLLTYLSVWSGLGRDSVALGQEGGFAVLRMQSDFERMRDLLNEFTAKHGHYPQSLDELPGFKEWNPVDPWKRPYQYVKRDKGFRLFSLGQDGKPGGENLDADIEPDRHGHVELKITLGQFLFRGEESLTLFLIALAASLCSGLACFIAASAPREGVGWSWMLFVFSILGTLLLTMIVVSVLIAVHFIGSGH